MQVFNLLAQQEFDPERHVEKILGTVGEGDVSVACWEPGQISPDRSSSIRNGDLFLLPGRGHNRIPARQCGGLPDRSWSTRRGNCTNTPMGRSARCYFECAMAPI